MDYTTDAYLITCLTNMHVGSGGANYGVVDNLVQRDSINNMPAINSSSLKGALREFFKDLWGENDEKLNYIFGMDSSQNSGAKGNDDIGHYKFFPADLLVLPIRSNKKPFFRATAPMLIDTINAKAKAFKVDMFQDENPFPDNCIFTNPNNANFVILEDWKATIDETVQTNPNLGENAVGFDDDTFKKLAKKLPVIARNQLDNGESKNLWYEEVVPRESRFVFIVAKDGKYSADFDEGLKDSIVQIGANASIGYGYVTITKISKP